MPDTKDPTRQPVASLLLASCAIVALAYWLGATWLASRVLAIPAGLWAVAVVFAVLRWGERLVLDAWINRLRSKGSFGLGYLRERIPHVIEPIAAVPDRLARAASGARDGWRSDKPENDSVSYGISHIQPSNRPAPTTRNSRPRVGIDLADHLANRLMHTPGSKRVQWVTLRAHALRNQELCRLHRLDAVVHEHAGALCITPADTGPLEPTWPDWSEPASPITYATVFPMRTDAARITLGQTQFANPSERDIAATLIDAIVHLRSAPLRIDRNRTAPAADAPMRHLAGLIVDHEQDLANWAAYRAACRAMTAWLSVNPASWNDDTLLQTITACTRTLSDEPEAHLRAAAVRFHLADDDNALDAIATADAILRTSERISPDSQLPFIQSELNMGGDDPLAFGRIASGLCLCAAGATADEIAYLRDDLLDEARFTEWLIGRDDERLLLMKVFRELERSRADDSQTHFHAA